MHNNNNETTGAQQAEEPLMNRRLFTILLIVFVQIVGASMVLPLLPLYAQRRFDMSPQTITLLISSFFLAQFLAGPTIGRLSDRYGRVPILIISQIGTAISFFMIGAAESFAVLLLARVFDGITGGNIIVANAYVTDITPRHQRTQALGLIFAAFGLGFIIGPAAGGALAAAFGDQVPFFLAAVAAVAVTVLTWFTLDETLSAEQREANRKFRSNSLSIGQIRKNAALMQVIIIGFGGQFGLGIVQATFALYGEEVLFAGYEPQAISLGVGLLLAAIGLGQFITQIVILPRLVKRVGESQLVLIGTIIRGIAMTIYAVVLSPYLGAIGSLTFALGTGLMMPPLQSIATDTVPDQLRGGVLGVYQSAVSIATIFSTALSGFIFAISPTLPYWMGAVLFFALAIPSLGLVRKPKAKNFDAAGASQPEAEAEPSTPVPAHID